jgi:hypothetical protein
VESYGICHLKGFLASSETNRVDMSTSSFPLLYNSIQPSKLKLELMWKEIFLGITSLIMTDALQYRYFIKSKIKKDVRIIFLPSTKNLNNIDYCKNFVIALTHHKNWIFSLGIPNHYIQVIDAKNNKIKYWSWGKIYETSISKYAFHALVIINNKNAK